MELINQYHEVAGITLARVILGLLFFFQGYDAVFNIRIKNVIGAYQESFTNKGMPRFLIVCGAWFNTLTEFVCGLLLIVGLFQYPALYLLGLNLVVASIAFGINTPVWDTRHVFPRLALLVLLLLCPPHWNLFSLDNLIF